MAATKSGTATYTTKDVAAHQHANDLWIIIHSEVFDVSGYINDHPGGADIFSEIAGNDGSEAFDNAQHSEDAMKIKADFRVGRLEGAESRKPLRKAVRLLPPKAPSSPGQKQRHGLSQVFTALSAGLGFSIVCFGVWWCAPSFRIIASPDPKSVAIGSFWDIEKGLGFTEGVLCTSTVFAVLAYLAYRRFQATMELWTGQWRYESHLRLPKIARPDVSSRRGWLDPAIFQKLHLAKKKLLAPNTYHLVFNLPKSDMVLGLPAGQHIAIRGFVEGKPVSRSYTPISSNADHGVLELVVRCYDHGVFTNGYVRNLEVGDEVDVRGPKGGIRYRRGLAQKFGMVAGGTGITPMYQLIRAICEDPRDTTEVSLIYANRREKDIMLRHELNSFAIKYPRNFKVFYVLDQAPPEWRGGCGFVSRKMMEERFAVPSPTTKIAVCGPPPMVKSVKELLGELGFQLPGTVMKSTDNVICF